MIARRTLVAAGLSAFTTGGVALAGRSAGGRQALQGWKLQIPGPREIPDPAGYVGESFRIDGDGSFRFWVDCAEQGATPHSTFVRSELRHAANWTLVPGARRSLAARMAVSSTATPDKVTALQIHGITTGGENVSPLLRVAVDQGAVTAHVKTDAGGERTDHIVLLAGIGAGEWACRIGVEGRALVVAIDGEETLRRDISFWPHANYFKLGCYPQAHAGEVIVTARDVAVVV